MRSKLVGALIATSCVSASSLTFAETRTGGAYDLQWSGPLNAIQDVNYTKESFGISWSGVDNVSGSFSLLATFKGHSSPLDLFPTITTGGYVTIPDDSQLRFSYWHFESTLEIFDVTANKLIATKTTDIHGGKTGGLGVYISTTDIPLASTYRFTETYKFTPGSVLTPSLDPACQSLSCMTLSFDRMNVSMAVFTATTVPETSSALMLLFGLGAVCTAIRRGRARYD